VVCVKDESIIEVSASLLAAVIITETPDLKEFLVYGDHISPEMQVFKALFMVLPPKALLALWVEYREPIITYLGHVNKEPDKAFYDVIGLLEAESGAIH